MPRSPSARRRTRPARSHRSSPRRGRSIARRRTGAGPGVSSPHMPPRSLLAALLALVAAAAGCEGQPSLLCDRSRVVWPFFEIDTADDTSDAEGIQIDLDLRTSYLPGSVAHLTIEP